MSYSAFHRSAFAGFLLVASQFSAPAQTASAVPSTTITTGIVGVTGTQTARLNVLNLQPVIPGVTAVACPATLEFFDDTGALLKQQAVASISPGAAVSLVFKPPVPTAVNNPRAQIRAVVVTPSVAATTGAAPAPIPVTFLNPGCNVMASLEIFDDATGATQLLTTDLRSMPGYLFGVFNPAKN
jgi:hypothetical protein